MSIEFGGNEGLMDLLARLRQQHEEQRMDALPTKVLCDLAEDEAKEFALLRADSNRLNEQFTTLLQERDVIQARDKIFWHQLRRRHSLQKVGHVRVDTKTMKVLEVIEDDNKADDVM